MVPFDRDRFDDAPDIDPDVELTEEQERALHEHYGRESWSGARGRGGRRRHDPLGGGGQRRQARSAAERVRLKKVIVEDEVTETVPVRKEKIRLETEPPPEGRIESVEEIDER